MVYEARGCGARLCKDIECKAKMQGCLLEGEGEPWRVCEQGAERSDSLL